MCVNIQFNYNYSLIFTEIKFSKLLFFFFNECNNWNTIIFHFLSLYICIEGRHLLSNHLFIIIIFYL